MAIPKTMRFLRSLRLVLWKNFMLQGRNKTGLLVEMLAPLVLFAIVAYVRTTREPKEVGNVSFAAQALPSAGVPVFMQSILCGGVSFCDADNEEGQTPLGRAALILRDDPDLQPEGLRELLDNVTATLDDLNRSLTELGVDYFPELSTIDGEFDLLDGEVDSVADAFDAVSNASGFNASTFENEQQELRRVVRELCNFYKSGQLQEVVDEVLQDDPVGNLQNQINNQVNGTSVAGGLNLAQLLSADDPVEAFLADIRTTDGFINDYVPRLLADYDPSVVKEVQSILTDSGDMTTEQLRKELQGIKGLNSATINNIIGINPENGGVDSVVDALQSENPIDALRDTNGFVTDFIPAALGTAFALPDSVIRDVQNQVLTSTNLTGDELLDRLRDIDGINDTIIDQLIDVGSRIDFANISTNDLIANVSEAVNNPNFTDAAALVNQNRTSGTPGQVAQDITTRLNSTIANVVRDFQDLQDETNRTQRVIDALQRISDIPEISQLVNNLNSGSSLLESMQKAICPSAMGKQCSYSLTFYDNSWEQSRRNRRDRSANDQQVDSSRGARQVDSEQVESPPDENDGNSDASDDGANLASANAQLQNEVIGNLLQNLTIFYAPSTPETDAIIKMANKTFEEIATYQQVIHCLTTLQNSTNFSRVGLNLTGIDDLDINATETFATDRTHLGVENKDSYEFDPYIDLDAFQGFDTVKEMIDAAMTRPPADVIASIEFENVDTPGAQLKYSIRMHYQKIPSTLRYARRYPRPGTGGNEGSLYYYSGFLWIQDMIDRAFTDLHSESDVWSPPVFMRQFPVLAYRRDNFAWGIGRMFPLLFTLAWIYTVAMVCKSVVHEKETRLKEYMKIMGMGSGVHWIGWFITKMSVVTSTVILLTIILKAGKVCEHSDPLLLFVLLELFGAATIVLSFMLSTFFSKARLAAACGGIIYFLFYFPYVFVTRFIDSMSRGQKLAASSLSTTAFGIAADYIGKFEEMGVGVQWDNMYDGLSTCDNYSLGDAMVMLAIDAVWMMLVTLYIEAVFPGEYGIPLPWYFFLSPSYWRETNDIGNANLEESTENVLTGPHFEKPQPGKKGVSIRHLTKKYGQTDCHFNCLDGEENEHIAVNNLNLDMAEDEITALLGHNGAGKTTTMSILCGLFPPTTGTAYVGGYDIRTDMPSIRSSLGVCPQYNVLFDRLTVYECLWFAARLKGMDVNLIDSDIAQFLGDLGFSDKRDVYTENLSGGMKRKLSVAMAFIGGSKIVILDEPTAGMDPSARRSTWDLLLRYKKGRTLMLSTHHMDEADLLSDRVAIIAKGVVRCIGSSLFLKTAFGAGYTVTMELGKNPKLENIDSLVTQHVPDAKLVDTTDHERAFVLPCKDQHLYGGLFSALEEQGSDLEVSGYGVTATSLEEVFIKVAEDADEDGDDERPSVSTPQASESVASIDQPNTEGGYIEVAAAGFGDSHSGNASKIAEVTPTTKMSISEQPSLGPLKTGISLWRARWRALAIKRFQHSARDRKAILAQILLPAFFVMAGMWVATNFPPGEDLPELSFADTAPLQQPCANEGSQQVPTYVPYAHLDETNYGRKISESASLGTPGFSSEIFTNLTGKEEFTSPSGSCGSDCAYPFNMSSYLLDSFDKEERFRRVAMSIEDAHDPWVGLSIGDSEDPFTMTAHAWFDNRAFHASGISLGVVNNAILHANSKVPNPRIETSNFPVPKTSDDKLQQLTESFTDLLVAINVMIALSFIPASFVLYLVQERVSKSKHLQFVSGVQPLGYWLANYAWDSLNFLVPLSVTILVFVGYDLPAYTGRNLGCVIMLMLLYGWSITPAMYPFNWLFKVPSTAYVVLIVANLFVGLTCTLESAVLDLFQEDDPSLYEVGQILQGVFMIFPQFCLGRGLIEIAKNEYTDQFKRAAQQVTGSNFESIPDYVSPYDWNIAGKFLFAMALETIIFFLINLGIEYLIQRKKKSDKRHEDDLEGDATALSKDVADERARIMSEGEGGSNDVLRVAGLSKVYKSRGKTKLAVDRLYFGVPKGQCFGLLGVNGAGKTTTFKMLTGDISLTSGDAQVAGFSVRRGEGLQVKQNLGYCPQFDALDPFLTGRQTLVLFARLRGIEESRIPAIVDWTISRLQLGNWADRITRTYSGGNKRKLSVAIGMIGNPPVLFLDEPTSGMDPRARRFLWDMITANVHAGRCVILTSHSMEECDALCSRLAIMVNGQFQCLGSPQHLKNTYGDGYSLIMQVSGANPELEPVRKFMSLTYPTASLKEAHHGYIRYHLPREGLPPLSQIFKELEGHKAELNMEDYSVSQTSLDEIFCNFARLQDSDRDDDDKNNQRKTKNRAKQVHVYENQSFINPVSPLSPTADSAMLPLHEKETVV